MNFPANQKGFSLIEALLVLAITSIIGVAVMQIMSDSTNSMALSEAKFEELELVRQIQSNLVYKPSCEKNFKGEVIDNLTVADIERVLNSNGGNLFTKGQVVGNRSLMISDFEFYIKPEVKAALDTFKASWPAGVTYYMLDVEFRIKTEKLKTTLGGKEMTRKIPLKVKVDPSNIVLECFSSNDAENYTAMSNFCQQMGGSFNSTSNLCEFNQTCATAVGAQLVPSKCVDEKIEAAIAKAMADLATRTVASATPAPSATPAYDPYTIPWSFANPGPGCTGDGCAASDFGPCKGTFCRTNGGSCTGINCETGITTGTVKYDGTNMYSPSKPGPGCTGDGCHANDYGPCKGTFCTTNGGSCNGINCETGIIKK